MTPQSKLLAMRIIRTAAAAGSAFAVVGVAILSVHESPWVFGAGWASATCVYVLSAIMGADE